jgi:hypothetical protein
MSQFFCWKLQSYSWDTIGILNGNMWGRKKANSGKLKLPLRFIKQHDVRTYGGAEVLTHCTERAQICRLQRTFYRSNYWFNYTGLSEHNNKWTTILFTDLQRHVSTHTSHLQARTIFVYKVTVLSLGSQTLTCILHRCYLLYYNWRLKQTCYSIILIMFWVSVHHKSIWLSAVAIDLGRPYRILHPVSCHTPEAATTVFMYSWGWTQKESETYRVVLQLLINILPSCITLVLYIYYTNYSRCMDRGFLVFFVMCVGSTSIC